MFVCLGFGHFILFVYFFPWPRSSKGPRMGRQFFKNVDLTKSKTEKHLKLSYKKLSPKVTYTPLRGEVTEK